MSDITVNGRFLTRAPTGVDRFAAELLRAWLPLMGGKHSVRALMPAKSAVRESHDLNLQEMKVGALTGHAWEQLELPRRFRLPHGSRRTDPHHRTGRTGSPCCQRNRTSGRPYRSNTRGLISAESISADGRSLSARARPVMVRSQKQNLPRTSQTSNSLAGSW